jgi:hypothetical protein
VLETLIPWVAALMRGLVLYRGISCGVIRRYPFFYAFIGGTLIVEVVVQVVYVRFAYLYTPFYWAAEFLTLLFACGIIFEIFDHVFIPFPGPQRFARLAGVVAFGATLFSSGIYPWVIHAGSINARMEELERNLRSIEALFLAAVLALIAYYRIRIGRNMKGMIAGYGISIVVSLTSMAVDTYTGGAFAGILGVARQLGYAVPVGIWALALWSYRPNPASMPPFQMEEDYERFAGKTQGAVLALRGYIGRAVGPSH